MSAPVLHVIACAHGTHDAAGRDVIDGLRADLAALLAAEGPGAQVHEAYVDVQSPSLDEVVAALPPGEPAVTVPLLLLAAIGLLGYAVYALWQRRKLVGLVAVAASAAFAGLYLTVDRIPESFVFFTPHVLTLLVLSAAAQRLRMPAANGKPYRRGEH